MKSRAFADWVQTLTTTSTITMTAPIPVTPIDMVRLFRIQTITAIQNPITSIYSLGPTLQDQIKQELDINDLDMEITGRKMVVLTKANWDTREDLPGQTMIL